MTLPKLPNFAMPKLPAKPTKLPNFAMPKLPAKPTKLPNFAMPKLPAAKEREQADDDPGPTIEEMVDALAEDNLTEGQQYFREARANEKATFKLNTDSEYWCALVFESREQKDKFLAHFDAVRIAGGNKYLNGVAMAQAMGVDIGPPVKWPGQRGPSKRLTALARKTAR